MNSNHPGEGFGGTPLKDFVKLLLQRRGVLSKDVRGLEEAACTEWTETSGDASSIHPAEQATDNIEQEVSLGRMESESREIDEIDGPWGAFAQGLSVSVKSAAGRCLPSASARFPMPGSAWRAN